MKGTIRLNVHYFEDGNVQLNSTFNKDVNIRVEVCYEILLAYYLLDARKYC